MDPAQSPDADRRKYRRIHAALYCRPAGIEFINRQREPVDVSLGGVRIYSDDELRIGELLKMEFFLADVPPVTYTAEVKWIERLPDGAPARFDVGLEIHPAGTRRAAAPEQGPRPARRSARVAPRLLPRPAELRLKIPNPKHPRSTLGRVRISARRRRASRRAGEQHNYCKPQVRELLALGRSRQGASLIHHPLRSVPSARVFPA